ncbi:hypothetical protein ACSQ5K_15020 [Pseudomonas sp. PhalM4]
MKYALIAAVFLSITTPAMAKGDDGAEAVKRFHERNRLMFEKQRQEKQKREESMAEERKSPTSSDNDGAKQREGQNDQVSR